jgi:hypothetical protein
MNLKMETKLNETKLNIYLNKIKQNRKTTGSSEIPVNHCKIRTCFPYRGSSLLPIFFSRDRRAMPLGDHSENI